MSANMIFRLRKAGEKGFTLVEVSIAVLIFGVLAVTTIALVKTTGDSYADGSLHSYLNTQSRLFLEQVSRELGSAGINTLSPAFPANSTSLTFQMASGYANGQVVYAAPITYAFQYAIGEVDNGIDDNRDGRIDEGQVVRTENGQSVTLSLDLAENGITFTRNSNTVSIVITLERLDDKGNLVTYTRALTVQVRN